MKIAGIAGGVGTTVLATILGAEDLGLDISEADFVVARNDYRCAKALLDADLGDAVVVLVMEPLRTLTLRDFESVLGPSRLIVTLDHDPATARADDAGLLRSGRYTARVRRDLAKQGIIEIEG